MGPLQWYLNGLQFKWAPLQWYLNDPQFNWAPNNNIDPGGPSLRNLIFANQFKNAPTMIFKWAPQQ